MHALSCIASPHVHPCALCIGSWLPDDILQCEKLWSDVQGLVSAFTQEIDYCIAWIVWRDVKSAVVHGPMGSSLIDLGFFETQTEDDLVDLDISKGCGTPPPSVSCVERLCSFLTLKKQGLIYGASCRPCACMHKKTSRNIVYHIWFWRCCNFTWHIITFLAPQRGWAIKPQDLGHVGRCHLQRLVATVWT